jgi:hypothetical protein
VCEEQEVVGKNSTLSQKLEGTLRDHIFGIQKQLEAKSEKWSD